MGQKNPAPTSVLPRPPQPGSKGLVHL
jgi:hypothetical protein